MAAGLLTGRPEEEVSGFQGDMLKELYVVHARARKAMRSMVKALWPSDTPPESMEGLASPFKGADAALSYGRHPPAVKAHEKPGRW